VLQVDGIQRVFLVRHGEVFNPNKVLYGRAPGYRLSERGESQAKLVTQFLAEPKRNIGAIVVSPLQRARETAAPIAAALGLPVQTDNRLIEAGNDFEGTSIGAHPAGLLKPKNFIKLLNPFKPSWGEPFAEQAQRMNEAINDWRKKTEGDVVIVSHQSPIWMVRRFLEGKRLWGDPRKRQCSVCSVTTLTYSGGAETPSVAYDQPALALSHTLSKDGWSAK
jgi:broad specificity phosphatase PhoE